MTDKKFGLIIPKKVDKFKMRSNPIFNDESDEEERQSKRPKIPQKKIDMKSKLKEKSVDDPSIYEYDSIYDEMKAKEAESIAPKEKKNSRYIDTLLKAADKRKKEYERRIDKKIQEEREKEGDLYKDKEAFVTSSYKKKLEEKELEEEKERRENMLNEMMDITKQKDLSGFYRHFLKQTVGEEKIPTFGEKDIKKEPSCSKEDDFPEKVIEKSADSQNFKDSCIDQDSDGVEIDSDSDDKSTDTSSPKHRVEENTSAKKYDRKGNTSKSKAESYNVSKDKSKVSSRGKIKKSYKQRKNSSSSSDSDSDNIKDVSFNKRTVQKNSESVTHRPRHDSSSSSSDDEANKKSSSSDSEANKKSSSPDNEANKKSEEKPSKSDEQNKVVKKTRSSIYAKRTVGDIFTAAQARYFQRMALKNEK